MRFCKSAVLLAITIPLAGVVSVASAQTATRRSDPDSGPDAAGHHGSQLMTQQEMNEYRERMRLAKTEQERERIRADDHDRMKDRARERASTLPDEPPANRRQPGRPVARWGRGVAWAPAGADGAAAGAAAAADSLRSPQRRIRATFWIRMSSASQSAAFAKWRRISSAVRLTSS